MEGKENISQYRERMDHTLASHDLVNEEALKAILKNQLLYSSEHDFKGQLFLNIFLLISSCYGFCFYFLFFSRYC